MGTAFRRMKAFAAALAVCATVVGFGVLVSACGSSSSSTGGGGGGTSETSGGDKGAIAMSFGGLEIEIWANIISLMKPEIANAGYEFLVDDPQFEVNKQIQDIEGWIARGDVKAIMAYPLQVDAIEPVTERANESGVPIVGYTQEWNGTKGAFLTDPVPDGERLGKDAGEWIEEKFPDQPIDVAILTDKGSELTKGRSEGMRSGVEESAPNANIYEIPALTRNAGYNGAKSQLAAHPETKVWIGVGDDNMQGAYRALLDSGVSKTDPNYFLGSLDVTKESLEVMQIPNSIWRVGYGLTAQQVADINCELLIEAAERGEAKVKIHRIVKVTPQNIASFLKEPEEEDGSEESDAEE